MSQQDTKEKLEQQKDVRVSGDALRTAVKSQQKSVSKRKFNPNFLEQIQDPDIDSEVFDWIRDEFPALFSGAHILGNRSEHYEDQQELLNTVRGEEYIVENSPGRLLKEHPEALAVMQGVDSTDAEDFREPIESPERRVVRESMQVGTTRQSLAVGAKGIEALTTATAEHRQVEQESNESDTKRRVASIFQ